jgi:hypothetical protein
MAALGAFRQAAHISELGNVKLAWSAHAGQWCAVLHTTRHIESAALIELLLDRVKSMPDRREFTWADAVKNASREQFVNSAQLAINEATADGHELADWFSAFGSDLKLKNEKIESTPLDMTVARQQFLADADWLTANLATPDKKSGDSLNAGSFGEALFGPWKYSENQHSLGWDPSTILMGAFTPKAPTAMDKAGVRGAVWLAMESLPFFPCMYDGHLATRAFVRSGRKQTFQWPIWAEPLSSPAISILLSQTPEMVERKEWKARGIAAVYSSHVYKPNKYLSSFQPAVLLG